MRVEDKGGERNGVGTSESSAPTHCGGHRARQQGAVAAYRPAEWVLRNVNLCFRVRPSSIIVTSVQLMQ